MSTFCFDSASVLESATKTNCDYTQIGKARETISKMVWFVIQLYSCLTKSNCNTNTASTGCAVDLQLLKVGNYQITRQICTACNTYTFIIIHLYSSVFVYNIFIYIRIYPTVSL